MFSWFKSKATTPDVEVSQPEEKKTKTSWFQRLKTGLSATSKKIFGPLGSIFSQGGLDPESYKAFKKSLIEADLGSSLVSEIMSIVQSQREPEQCRTLIREKLYSLCRDSQEEIPDKKVLLMIGVNGAGKTTTCAKIAHRFADLSPILIAADTYRAAATDQLEDWAQRQSVKFYTDPNLTDPAAVAYAGLQVAAKEGNKLSIIDTSGRLHTSKNLMSELQKIKKVVLKNVEPKQVLTLLTLDASQGQNMLRQVEVFNEYTPLDGLIITKLDGTSKAGAIFDIMAKFKISVYFIGCGEGLDDLQIFNKDEFIDALFQ